MTSYTGVDGGASKWTWDYASTPEPIVEEQPDNAAALRRLLQKWVYREEARHPDFQDKELIQESKELINKSRDGNELLRTPETF